MKRASVAAVALLAGAVLLGGCGRPEGGATSASRSPSTGPQSAQPKLPTVRVWLGTEEIEAEVALTRTQIQTGMMFRTNIADGEGMLFVFSAPTQAAFWMKNVSIPLTCAYIDPDGTILELHDLRPQDTNPIVAGTDRVQFVLEMAQGWFGRHQVNTGALVRTAMGPLRETFLGAGGRRRR